MCLKEICPPPRGGLREDLRYTEKKGLAVPEWHLSDQQQLIQGEMGKTDLKLVRTN